MSKYWYLWWFLLFASWNQRTIEYIGPFVNELECQRIHTELNNKLVSTSIGTVTMSSCFNGGDTPRLMEEKNGDRS